MAEKIERQLPTGIGGEELKEGRKTLPAVEVANEVSWVNNKMNLPFDLKVGEPSRLGMFLTPDSQTGEKVYNLEVSGSHTRSGILGRVIFSDKEGRLYRDIDLKGVGYNRRGKMVGSVGSDIKWSNFGTWGGTSGIADQELIRRDVDFSEKFLKAGIRTHRVIALIEPKEIIDQEGVKISIAEAKERGMLTEKDESIIEVRAFGVRSRIHDVEDGLSMGTKNNEKALKLLLDAKTMVAQELNIDPEKFSCDDYVEWLIKTTAINIARIHYNNWVSGYLTDHNITLDGRLVDLDSVEVYKGVGSTKEVLRGEKNFQNDCGEVIDTLNDLINPIRRAEIYSGYLDSPIQVRFYFVLIYEGELDRLKSEKVPKVRN